MLAVVIAGCGPLTRPMVQRLSEEDQAKVDEVWKNIFTPTDRTDHTLLLDIMLHYQLFQLGVDRLSLTSEKRFDGGTAIMAVRYDREHPELDAFTFHCVDAKGRLIRQERYTREEVDARMTFFWAAPRCETTTAPASDQQLEDGCTAQEREREREVEARLQEIAAATQPAVQVKSAE